MRTQAKIAALGLALGLTAGVFSGCLVVAAGAGAAGAAYAMGSLDATVPGSPEAVVAASKSVLEEKQLRDIRADATSLDGSVVAETALDKKVEITVQRQDERTCKISIRVGTFGDERMSQDIYDKIRAKLPAA